MRNRTVSLATFNASMNRAGAGQLAADLASVANLQIQQVAEVIQRADSDVILLAVPCLRPLTDLTV